MRVLRFFRPVRSRFSAVEATGPGDALGLDAFAAERPARATSPADRRNAMDARLRAGLVTLGILAIVEAVPTLLWMQNWLGPAEPTVTVAAAPLTPAPAPPAEATLAPCTPPPAAQPETATAAAAAPRLDEAARAAAARPAAPGLVAGLVSIAAPVPMHVYTGGRLIGTTEAESILLPVGEHDLELVSEAVGLRARRSVTVQPGRTSALRIDAPRVPVHVNAIPWAEVWIDNQRVGETPIGNLQQTVGSHEVVFRHPELGERRMMVTITLKEPARISMDLRTR